MKNFTVKDLSICALFTALTAVCSQIAIPIGIVPINLATFSVYCAGALLGARRAVLSQLIFILLGCTGLPLFSMFSGGVGILMGPTGGYIAGYAACAFITGLFSHKKEAGIVRLALSMLSGIIVCFFLGTLWFMHTMDSTLSKALSACVIPFLPGEAVKITAAVLTARRLKTTNMFNSLFKH